MAARRTGSPLRDRAAFGREVCFALARDSRVGTITCGSRTAGEVLFFVRAKKITPKKRAPGGAEYFPVLLAKPGARLNSPAAEQRRSGSNTRRATSPSLTALLGQRLRGIKTNPGWREVPSHLASRCRGRPTAYPYAACDRPDPSGRPSGSLALVLRGSARHTGV
jgi:hypothetical protein